MHTSKISLRDYQSRVVQQVVDAYRLGARSALVIAPTGSGKTRMISEAVRQMNLRCASFAHRREILSQIRVAMRFAGVSTHKESNVSSSSAPTVAASDAFDAVFFDEAHHMAAPSYLRLVNAAKGKFILGATATPYRTDGVRIDTMFDVVVSAGTARDIAAQGYLATVEYFALTDVDFVGIKRTLKNDFDKKQSFERVRISIQAGDVVSSWREHAGLSPALIYCINTEHCELVRGELAASGISAGIVTSRTKIVDRNEMIERFEQGDLKAIINCEIFTEGTDIKGVGTIILLRPTLSRGLYKQIIGRGLRPDVDCKVIDHVGNNKRHGDVLNEDEATIVARTGSARDAIESSKSMAPAIGKMSMHIELVKAELTKIWVPAAFLGGASCH